MDKTLYLSYDCFKNQPEHGIVIRLKDSQEFFYQIMVDTYKSYKPKWNDSQPVSYIKKSDIAQHIKIEDYLKEKQIDIPINSPELFQLLTKDLKLSEKIKINLKNDLKSIKIK